jgi:hypothetical protein
VISAPLAKLLTGNVQPVKLGAAPPKLQLKLAFTLLATDGPLFLNLIVPLCTLPALALPINATGPASMSVIKITVLVALELLFPETGSAVLLLVDTLIETDPLLGTV